MQKGQLNKNNLFNDVINNFRQVYVLIAQLEDQKKSQTQIIQNKFQEIQAIKNAMNNN